MSPLLQQIVQEIDQLTPVEQMAVMGYAWIIHDALKKTQKRA